MITDGMKTSEFWVTVITSFGTMLAAWGLDLDFEQMATVLAPFIAYILSRGWAKSSSPTTIIGPQDTANVDQSGSKPTTQQHAKPPLPPGWDKP